MRSPRSVSPPRRSRSSARCTSPTSTSPCCGDHPRGELATLDATAQAELVRRGEVTPAELVEAAIATDRGARPDPQRRRHAHVRAGARAADDGPTGPFAGVPYLLKDLACEMSGVRFTEGSRFLADNVSTFDQELVVRLRDRGSRDPRQDQHPRVRPGSRLRARALRTDPQPVERRPVHQRIERRRRGRRRVRHGALRARVRRRRRRQGGRTRPHPVGRDSAALLDATCGPAIGDPYWAPPPPRPFIEEVGADPGRLRIAFTSLTPDGDLGHPDCVAAVEDAARLCESHGHDVVEGAWPGFTPEVGEGIGTMIGAAVAWILRYWIRHVGREPDTDDIEPLTRVLWEGGERVTAAEWLLAVEETQRFSRRVAQFFTSADLFLTPTISAPPLPIGAMVSTPEDPWRSMNVSAPTVRYAGVVANLTGNPAMSVPHNWNDDGLPIGVHSSVASETKPHCSDWPPSSKKRNPGPSGNPRSTPFAPDSRSAQAANATATSTKPSARASSAGACPGGGPTDRLAGLPAEQRSFVLRDVRAADRGRAGGGRLGVRDPAGHGTAPWPALRPRRPVRRAAGTSIIRPDPTSAGRHAHAPARAARPRHGAAPTLGTGGQGVQPPTREIRETSSAASHDRPRTARKPSKCWASGSDFSAVGGGGGI